MLRFVKIYYQKLLHTAFVINHEMNFLSCMLMGVTIMNRLFQITSLYIFICFLSTNYLYSYPYLPIIKSYSKGDYKAGRQNWAIAFDSHGIVYFGNNEGVLKHVGNSWELIKTSKNDNVKSIFIENDTIWAGGSLQLGFFAKNENEKLVYHEISSGIKGQVWKICQNNRKVYAQTEAGVFIYHKETKETTFVEEDTKGFYGIVKYNGNIWGIDRQNRIGTFSNQDKFIVAEHLKNVRNIQSVFTHRNSITFLQENGTLSYYRVGKKQKDILLPKELTASSIFSCAPYTDKELLFGSITGGVYVYNIESKTITLNINADDGLMDNTVLAIKKDQYSNIWMALDYGISYVESQKVLKPIFAQGATYDFILDNDTTLLATNKGIFRSVKNEKFKLLDQLHGQAWRIKKYNNKKYICHNSGVYEINGENCTPVFNDTGVLDFVQYKGTNKYIVSAYTGLLFMEMINGKLKEIGNLYYWGNPKILYDEIESAIWAKSKDGELKKYTLINKERNIDTHVYEGQDNFFELQGHIVFYNNKFLSELKNDQFVKINREPYTKIKGEGLTNVVIDKNGHSISFIQNGKLNLLLNILDGNYYSFDKVLNSLENHLLKESENIKFFDKALWIPTDRGLEVLNPHDKSKRLRSPAPIISKLVVQYDDEKLSDQFSYPYKQDVLELSSDVNDIEFNFGVQKSLRDHIVYRYKLKGYEDKWSEWSEESTKGYTKIKGGDYVFILQSKLNGGNLKETQLKVHITKQWFETNWIFIPIFIVVALSILIIFKLYHIYSKNQLMAFHKKQQVQLEHEKLEIKNEQLLKYTEMLTHKNAFLREISDDLENVGHRKTDFWRKKIEKELSSDKKNLIFHELFKEINHDFITKVESSYPNLTQNDIRLVSLIRFSLNNNEIANIMNITQKSVVVNRYRLKKKLELPNEVDLDHFIKEL